jgi:hypothetical protein
MNCPNCNALNESNAKFCRNCGADLASMPAAAAESSNKDLMYVLIFLGWEYFIYLVWFVLQKLVVPIMFRSSGVGSYDFYKVFGWIEDLLSITLLIVFMTMVKNKTAKIAFIVFLIIRIIMLIGYRMLGNL